MEPRRFRHRDGTVLQQSMNMNEESLRAEGNMPSHVLGVVLEVYPADDPRNRTAFQRTDYRGYLHEASVLIVMDGTDSVMRLDNVVICPDNVSGLDHYSEHLPRGTTSSITGQPFNGRMNGIDPYVLDGDWCVVSFLGGSIRHPFISRWWPHSRNAFDPLTSGQGSPDDRGKPQALDQRGRYFRRINGIEHVITNDGDVYFSTRWANSTLRHDAGATEGRYARDESTSGGTVSVNIKPSQSLVIDFNEEVEGLHHLAGFDDHLPQTNPRTRRQPERRERTRTRLVSTDEEVRLSTTRIAANASESVRIEADEEAAIEVDGTTVYMDGGSLSIDADEDISFEADQILLGTGEPEKIIMGETYDNRTDLVLLAAKPAFDILTQAVATSATTAILAGKTAEALQYLWTTLENLQAQIEPSLTNKTRAE